MSNIKNKPKWNNFFLKAVRGTLEHRAQWLYLLLKEAEKKSILWEDIGIPAIRCCGRDQGSKLSKPEGSTSFKTLKKRLFTLPAQIVFEMKILKNTHDNLSIDFNYCPLVKAWQDMGCSDKDIARLCNIAMAGDRGIADSFGGIMELKQSIARGDKKCQVRFIRSTCST